MKCCHCNIDKNLSFFYKDNSKRSGYKPRCKPCDLFSRDKKKRAEYEKKYWDRRREERREMILKSHNKNKEHHKKQRKKYLQTPSGKIMFRRQSQTRYARKRKAFIEIVNPIELYEAQSGICYICSGYFLFSQMECDHVVPLAKNGLHEKKNLKMACVRCNRSKGAKLLEEVCHQVV